MRPVLPRQPYRVACMQATGWGMGQEKSSMMELHAHTLIDHLVVQVSVLSVFLVVGVHPGLSWRLKMHSFQIVECITSELLIVHM